MRRVFDEAGSCEDANVMHDVIESWERVRNILCSEVGTDKFNSWISPLVLESVSEGCAVLAAPREFQRFYVETHYGDQIRRIWASETKKIRQIQIRVRSLANKYSAMRSPLRGVPAEPMHTEISEQDFERSLEEATPTAAPGVSNHNNHIKGENGRLPSPKGGVFSESGDGGGPTNIGLPLIRSKTFATFVEGSSNREALVTARDFAKGLETSAPSLFIYGRVGAGKTHLLNAVGHSVAESFPGLSILYLSAERFMYHFVRALQRSDTLAFKDALINCDILLLDDVQFLGNKKSTQQEFFHAVDNLLSLGKRVVCCADVPPSQLSGVNERIIARLGQGFVVGIAPPDAQLRRDIFEIKLKAVEKQGIGNFKCTDELLDYLAQTLTWDIRAIEGGVYRIMSSLNAGHAVTVETVRSKIISDLLNAQPPQMTIAKIQKHTAEYFGFQVDDLCSKRRTKDVVQARHIAMYLCKELTPRSYPQIAARFGGKDHSTVIHAVNKIKDRLSQDEAVRRHVTMVKLGLEVH